MQASPLKAPFPYPGGKQSVADLVWKRLGNVDNYIEPFMGTGAALLRRPAEHFQRPAKRYETVTDTNHFIANFWRAVQQSPEEVAEHADWPVSEIDLHARHRWLVRSRAARRWLKRFREDPNYCCPKLAGWWVWGQCLWIGGGWCQEAEQGRGRNRYLHRAMPLLSQESGINCGGRPQLADAYDLGRGVHAEWQHGTCEERRVFLKKWLCALSDRLRQVRVCYGHWSRICNSDSTLTRLGLTGVFLDPPYPMRKANGTKSRGEKLYMGDAAEALDRLRDEVLGWCIRWAGTEVRVAVCGYEGDGYEALEERGWTVTAWESSGGYANQRRGGQKKSENARRERIWWSPSCQREQQMSLLEIEPSGSPIQCNT